MTAALKVVVEKVEGCADIKKLNQDWELLILLWGTPSFFLSWLWIGCWIKILPSNVCLYRATVYRGNSPEALVLVTSQRVTRKGIFSSHILAINESLVEGLNMVIEYNGLVGNRADRDVYKLMLSGLKGQLGHWDELQLSAVCEKDLLFNEPLLKELGLSPRLVDESYARFVDLTRLREQRRSFISSLRKKTRYKIRRYLSAFEKVGLIKVDVPGSVDEALQFLNELKLLHQTYWESRGHPGSFANPVWEAFHRNIIREGFDLGAIQLLKIKVGSELIGIVYSVVSEGSVSMMQSGYNYRVFKDMHPGYVSLVKVIEYNIDTGNNIFDFLAGDAQYKSSLATDAVKLKWVILQRPRLKLSIENMLRSVKHKIQKSFGLVL